MQHYKNTTILITGILLTIGTTKAQLWRCGDTLTDLRDGQKYPTVLIGKQCWTARNLNIGQPVKSLQQTNNNQIEKTCYDNTPANCDTFGGLYTYDEAMQYSNIDKANGICPMGWHIPSIDEWKTLQMIVPDGQELKAGGTDKPAFDGNNKSGFSAIPAGLAYYDVFGRKGDWAIFWSATVADKSYAWSAEIDNYYLSLGSYTNLSLTNTYLTINAFSVRCIKD